MRFSCVWRTDFTKDCADIRYIVLSCLVSADVLEVKAALFAAGCLCERSNDFANVFLVILNMIVLSPGVSWGIKLAGGADESSGCAPRSKRRRFEYTASFEVPAKEVSVNLQKLAIKHKVVLCIQQKYMRYKPFMAEVKDYACHMAGEPASSKKSRLLRREPYMLKWCVCALCIRVIV